MRNKTLCISAASLILAANISAKEAKKPNMIVIIGDDISWNDFGCYGHPTIKTPNIDKLAKNGIKFTNSFLTTSSCSPSRCSIVTGRYPHNTGACDLHSPLPEDQVTFPELLKESGYYTMHAGKWHFGSGYNKSYGGPLNNDFDVVGGSGKDKGSGGEKQWVSRLKNRDKSKPFFAWFASHDAHRTWSADNFHSTNSPDDVVIAPYMVDSKINRRDMASYYNEITRLDYYVGEVVKELKNQNEFDNTIIIVMADNGRPFLRCKTRVYESGMKTPFIISWPNGIKQSGKTSESLISAVDIAPTLLGIANVKIPVSVQGKSFHKILKSPSKKFRNYTFSEHNWHNYTAYERQVKDKRFMYVYNGYPELKNIGAYDIYQSPSALEADSLNRINKLNKYQKDPFITPRPVEELYDCINDPHQLHNLAADKKYSKHLKRLRKVFKKWVKQTGDSQPENPTPDNCLRDKPVKLYRKAKYTELAGDRNNATKINHPGPF